MADTTATNPALPAPSAEEEEEELPLITLFEPTEECICEFGDVILVADDGFHPVQKLRVSSCILAMSSKPFKALFSRNWAEGRASADRHSGEPHEIIVKDAPAPLKQLCDLLHHRIPVNAVGMPLSVSATDVLELAIVADKYDAVEAIRLSPDALLAKYTTSNSESFSTCPVDRLIPAALLLDQVAHFRRFTKELIISETMIQASHFDQRALDLLPSNLLASMLNQQCIARQELTTQISKLVTQFKSACELTENKHMLCQLVQELQACRLMPLNYGSGSLRVQIWSLKDVKVPLISTCDTVRKRETRAASTPGWGSGWGGARSRSGSFDSRYEHYVAEVAINAPTHTSIALGARKVEEMCVGICLDCILGRECREGHRRFWVDTKMSDDDLASDGGNGALWDAAQDRYDIFNTADFPGYWDKAW